MSNTAVDELTAAATGVISQHGVYKEVRIRQVIAKLRGRRPDAIVKNFSSLSPLGFE